MNSVDKLFNSAVCGALKKNGFNSDCAEYGKLMLAQLMVKAAAGFYNSYTEENFMSEFGFISKRRSINKRGAKFLKEFIYASSCKKPPIYFACETHLN